METHICRGVLTGIHETRGHRRWQVQGIAGEVLNGIEVLEPFGYAGQAALGTEVLVLTPGGRAREQSIAICMGDPSSRPSVEPGEVHLYDHSGGRVTLTGGVLTVSASQVFITGDLQVSGTIAAGSLTVQGQTDLQGTTINGVPQIGA